MQETVNNKLIELIKEKLDSGISKKRICDDTNLSSPTFDLFLMNEMSHKTKAAIAKYLKLEINEVLISIKGEK